jgi:DNA repair protein RecN (Recombination protein N)
MPNVRFNIDINATETYFQNGKDSLQFYFLQIRELILIIKKVASGGEMSRIMLAVKAILAKYSKLPTLIFDEIDTGVSGEIAIRMGEIMKEMSLKCKFCHYTFATNCCQRKCAFQSI